MEILWIVIIRINHSVNGYIFSNCRNMGIDNYQRKTLSAFLNHGCWYFSWKKLKNLYYFKYPSLYCTIGKLLQRSQRLQWEGKIVTTPKHALVTTLKLVPTQHQFLCTFIALINLSLIIGCYVLTNKGNCKSGKRRRIWR